LTNHGIFHQLRQQFAGRMIWISGRQEGFG
jgi:hypothetical protein